MERFALLLDSLSTTPSRNGKLALLSRYFRDTPDQIDYNRTARVVAGLAGVIKNLAGESPQDNSQEKK